MTNQTTNAGINVLAPSAVRYKFQACYRGEIGGASKTSTTSTYYDGDLEESIYLRFETLPSNTSLTYVHKYWACGTDFNLHYFLNTPLLYKQLSQPTPL